MSANAKIENSDKKISLPLEAPYRLLGNILILAFIFGLAMITITIKDQIIGKTFTELTRYFYEQTNRAGLTIDDIVIENRVKTPLKDIKRILDLDRGKNILDTDTTSIREQIESLPWVKSATVRRIFFPNVIQISLREKEVESLWQVDGRFYPIDEDGKVINADFIPVKPIMLIVGKGAPEHFKELLQIIKKDAEIFERIKVAHFISERRWNVILDNVESGITVKLPESGIDETWNRLIKINNTRGLFKRKLTIIDLRLPDKVIVKIEKTNPEDKNKLENVKESKS